MNWNDDYPEMLKPRETWGLVALIFLGWAVPVAMGIGVGYLIWWG